ncbi:MAG: penicillin acylase family protein [Desulfatitalea sp.]|nr:penicillin acylase family protein [Desulfatitalea sp.]
MANASELINIAAPLPHEKQYEDTVEIVVLPSAPADPATFRAWLNHQEITDRFEWVAGQFRAVVGAQDGLRIFSEQISTTRDEKGVWFIKGDGRSLRFKKGMNLLSVFIKGTSKKRCMKRCVFLVDQSLYHAFEAMGYAVATDRLWQAEIYRRSARGTLAEIFGPDMLETDAHMRTTGYSEQELETGLNALSRQERAVISAYAAGFNRRIDEVRNDPGQLPFEFVTMGFSPDDWNGMDILAWGALTQRHFDLEALDQSQISNSVLLQYLMQTFPDYYQGMFEDLRWHNDPAAQTYIGPQEALLPRQALGLRSGRNGYLDHRTVLRADLKTACKKMRSAKANVLKTLRRINAFIKMGSYAWAVSGKKTASGNPILYSGPQMGFSVPSTLVEGDIRAAGINVSGMAIPGIPGIIVGRTPHHAWSLQVGHSHSTDYYIESPEAVYLDRVEVIRVAGQADTLLPVYRTARGPIVNPTPYHDNTSDPIISWRYAHWGHEFNVAGACLKMSQAKSIDAFGEGIEMLAVSQHVCYADRFGNIAYWMSGRDPVRPEGGEYRLPQGLLAAPLDWDDDILKPRSHGRNPESGFFGGWNNKSNPGYGSGFNSTEDIYGPFHRAHLIESFLQGSQELTFEQLRDFALNITTTDSFPYIYDLSVVPPSAQAAGNPWLFVADSFTQAVQAAGMTPERHFALETLKTWDGHSIAGGPGSWAGGKYRSGAWVLIDNWLREVIRLTFEDELPIDLDEHGVSKETYMGSSQSLLFNVILHALQTDDSGIINTYDWFSNRLNPDAPQNADDIIVAALDHVMEAFGGAIPEDVPRGEIVYYHDILGELWRSPYSYRSTYAQIVEMGPMGPVRIESMFPLGESGNILMGADGGPIFDPHFFSMTPIFDTFAHRPFPVFLNRRPYGK